jgi:outer membrane autotransporter protein
MNFSNLTSHFSLLSAAFLASMGAVSAVSAATPVQEMSRSVETLCPSLKASFNANPTSLTPAEQDVYFRCAELKLAAGQSFANLSQAQRNGLGNMTSDETSVMGAATVALSGAQNIAVLGRLSGLRSKTASAVAGNGSPGSPPETVSSGTQTLGTSHEKSPAPGDDGGAFSVIPFDTSRGYQGNFSQMSDYGKWGFFVNGSFGSGNKDATSREPGFDFDSWSLVSGLDYRLTDQLVMGLALGYAVTDSSIDNNGGDVDLDGFGGSVYGSYYLGSFYFDFLVGVAGKEYDTTRNVRYIVPATTGGTTVVDQVFAGNTDATDVNFGFGTGYNLSFGGLAVTPFVNLAYLESTIDGYTESLQGQNSNAGFGLALRLEEQEVKSLASNLGLQLAYAVNTSRGVLTPYVRADWEHEFENDARNITAHFANVGGNYDALNTIIIPTDDPDRDFANLGVGLSAVLPGGLQCFVDYSTVLGYEDITLHRFVAGLRMEF